MKPTLSGRIALAVLKVAFPVAALAGLNQTATLQANTTLSLDTGATSTVMPARSIAYFLAGALACPRFQISEEWR